MSKSLDGIRKLNEEEVKRSRKIVLDFIGEKDKVAKQKAYSPNNKRGKAMDGIILADKSRKKAKKKIVKTDRLEQEIKREEKRKAQEFKKRLAEELEEKNRIEQEKKIIKEKAEEKRKRAKEKIILEKQKEKLLKKKIAESQKRAKKRKEERIRRNKNRIKKIKLKLEKIKKKSVKVLKHISSKNFLKKVRKILAFSIVFIFLFAILIYMVVALLLLKFNVESKISKVINNYIPIPAVVTNVGMVDYYSYKNLKKFGITEKNDLIENIILSDFGLKYTLSTTDDIRSRFVFDKDINKVANSRINKIYKFILEGKDFNEVGEKYGDEADVFDKNSNEKMKVLGEYLSEGEVSNILSSNQGYYILKKENYAVNYIFVKAISLDEYIADKQEDLKVWILTE